MLNLSNMVKNLIFLLFACLLIDACKEKKKPTLSGEEPVSIEDFMMAFEEVKPTYEIADSNLAKNEPDSLLISYKIFTQFIPDSILTLDFGKNSKPKIYFLNKVSVEKGESYLFVKAVHSGKKILYVLCFDKEKKFNAAMPLMKYVGKRSVTQIAGIDRKFSIFRNTYQKKQDGSVAEGKEVFVYNTDARQFILIMTDALDDRVNEVINPIDTLGMKNKYSADYIKDKLNIVSIRDADKPGKLNFFIHFDRSNGECTGELKAVASFIKSNVAEYRQAGDICILQFIFYSSSVTIKELGPCGTHRGVKCSFDGNYPRKKDARKKSTKN